MSSERSRPPSHSVNAKIACQAVALCEGPTIARSLSSRTASTVNPNSSAPTLAHAAEREKKLIMQALAPTKGNVTAAAKKLRILAGEPCIEDSTKMNLAKAADI